MADNIILILESCANQTIADSKSKGKRLSLIIENAINYIGKPVNYLGKEIELSWRDLESYLNDRKPDGHDLYAHIMTVFAKRFTIEKLTTDNLVDLTFQDQQSAIAFFDFLSTILPLKNATHPAIYYNNIIMTDDQFFFCNRFSQYGTRKLTPEYLSDCLLKTLRADEFDFSYPFILGIIRSEEGNTRHQNLRPNTRQPYTITPDGQIRSRSNRQSMHSSSEKKGFSQIQPCTFIDDQVMSPAFGFGKGRNTKLYGLVTHINDTLISRMLMSDSGTVSRIFDYPTKERAEQSLSYQGYKSNLFYPPQKMSKFKTRLLCTRPENSITNEVLARLRFNPYRSVVTICSDTLEARLLAYDFAQELLEHYATYISSCGGQLNSNFRIPIIFYLPKSRNFSYCRNDSYGHELRFYTPEMHLSDQLEAVKIFHDKELRKKCYSHRNYEFLLGLNFQEFLPDHMLGSGDDILLVEMVQAGYTRMLMRLLRNNERTCRLVSTSQHNSVQIADNLSLIDKLVDRLIKLNPLTLNNIIIAKLILAELFEIADRIIAATNSDKYQIRLGDNLLVNHLIRQGNPRQLNYMGLDKILIIAAEKNSWVTVGLCLKEFPHLDKALLGTLLHEACRLKRHKEAELLLKMGADRTQISSLDGKTAMAIAIEGEDWFMVELISKYSTDPDDKATQGYAILAALRHQHNDCLLSAALKTIDKQYYHHESYRSAFYQSWVFASTHRPVIAKQLVSLLGSSHIRHFTLMYIFALFSKSCHFNGLRDTLTPLEVRKIEHAYRTTGIMSIGEGRSFLFNEKYRENYVEMLNILSDYFAVLDKIPEEKIIIQTYRSVRSLFEKTVKNNANSIHFFEWTYCTTEFNKGNLCYMQNVDQLLADHRPKCVTEESALKALYDYTPDFDSPSCSIL